jgi:hypothetical protein
MAKEKKQSIGELIEDIQSDIKRTDTAEIPDIITFVESEEWLGIPFHPTNPLELFPMQKIMLKTFYRGTIGNEDLKLTESEIALIEETGLNEDGRGNFLDKYNNEELFRELVLVWGRRSGKDFIVSIIALYEAMKLLECEGGDPYSMYELSSANTINILTVANAKGQANIAFAEIREKLFYSEYFKDKYTKDGISQGAIYLLTPQDKINNREFKDKGLPVRKGSIGIIVGHSNSDTLLGMGCIVLILDEVASYKTTGGSSSGDRIYAALTPTVQTYVRKTYVKDDNGEFVLNEHGQKIIKERIYDGKVISISSPRAKEGKFYELFNNAGQVPTRLSMRLATWHVNIQHTRESLRSDNNIMAETEFNMEFGAEFSGTGLESFFSEDQVKQCFTGHNLRNVTMGTPGKVYFIHLDPATSSHNYALVVVHKEYYLNIETQKADFRVVVDHIKYWTPDKGPINPNEVMQYVLNLKRKFHIGLVTYDAFTSQESILKMRKAGIPNKETKFLPSYKFVIYKELENLINTNRLFIPYDNLLYQEMIELQRKFTPTGFKVLPKQDGDGVKSDDVVDCIAGACYVAVEKQMSRLPHAKLASLGNPGGNQIAWRTMQGGVYGVGSGGQVSKALENRSRLYSNLNNFGRRPRR